MTLARRLLFYFGGFGIGIMLLFFFLGGKRASCDYGPNARTLKNIRQKQRAMSNLVLRNLERYELDTSAVGVVLNNGEVNFQASNTALDSCKIYVVDGTYKNYLLKLTIENCPQIAEIKNLEITTPSY